MGAPQGDGGEVTAAQGPPCLFLSVWAAVHTVHNPPSSERGWRAESEGGRGLSACWSLEVPPHTRVAVSPVYRQESKLSRDAVIQGTLGGPSYVRYSCKCRGYSCEPENEASVWAGHTFQ